MSESLATSAQMTDTVSAPLDGPGWFDVGVAGVVAEWDGSRWTGAHRTEGSAVGLPGWTWRSAKGVNERWLGLVLLGQIVIVGAALGARDWHEHLVTWVSLLGYVLFMAGAIQLVGYYLGFDRLDRKWQVTGIGLLSGAVAAAVSILIEKAIRNGAGATTAHWLAGPIKISAIVLLPWLLARYGSSRLATARVGLYLSLISAATVGSIQGAWWQSQGNPLAKVGYSLFEPATQLFVVLVVGCLATALWARAPRDTRWLSRHGTVALIGSFVIVSVHDVLYGLLPQSSGERLGTLPAPQTFQHAILSGLYGLAASAALAFVLVTILRYVTRDLVPPSMLVLTKSRFRPRVVTTS